MSDVPLREYLEIMFTAHQRELDAKHEAMESALRLAREDVSRRLNELNQLRKEVIDDRDQYVSKLQFEPMMREINTINDRITRIETKGATWTVAIGLFFVLLQIALMVFMRK
jgi:hypothetical protein